ncbi:ABC transporter permease subunit [Anaeromicropila herbilytica]|uniref:ABC-2 type transporter transmembrane domain-containing protein n=1 Tax=Anaeromicropila herbilytica TaxID=2785025 RepID=A0A7R7EJ70_9FIRM|nr:ABC transporter permease subunit [Anaeromicropila herbilytica]BCN29816.1 hypothetical protein bsdtb5_11110 [Anaeromicropila herbilytica]
MLAIYKKELKSYFTSMVGYVFISLFLVVIGIYFYVYNLSNGYANFEYVLSSISFLFIVLIPILTMRLMAEEKRQKTDQLLFTSPLSEEKIIIGKYLAVLTVFVIAMVITLIYPIILTKYGTVDLKLAYAGILGFTMLGGAYLSIGLFISTLTENQVVAAVVCFIVVLLTYLMTGIAGMLPSDNCSAWIIFSVLFFIVCLVTYFMMHNITLSIGLGIIGECALAVVYFVKPSFFDGSVVKFFKWFSVIDRYDNFSLGILDLTSIIYYITLIILFLVLTVQAIKKRRWS